MNFSDVIKAFTAEGPWGKIECGDWLVAVIGIGLFTFMTANSDKVEGWVRAATGHDGEVDAEKLRTIVEDFQSAKSTQKDNIDFSAMGTCTPTTGSTYTSPTYEGLGTTSHNVGVCGSNFKFIE